MVLTRRLSNIIMVTYLPTILMNMVNQATNYITGDTKYDMIYTVNITCMMVLASVYLSVSSSLHTTSDIKPVEVWLIFNLAYPFLTILVNVLLQVCKAVDCIYVSTIFCRAYREKASKIIVIEMPNKLHCIFVN